MADHVFRQVYADIVDGQTEKIHGYLFRVALATPRWLKLF